MSRNILMVYPKIPTTYWSFDYALPFIGRRASIPPLGLMTVAAMLPRDDYRIRLLDMNVEELGAEDVLWADLVFVSAMIVQKSSFQEVVALCRECGRPVVAGGPYPMSSHREIQGVDSFVLDEAELTLPRFLADLEAGRPRRVYRDPRKPELTDTPPPRFDLIEVGYYDTMPLQYSRGCPYACEFCDIIAMFGRRQRTKAPRQFLRELETVLATGFRGSVFVVDDNFVGNHRRVKELLRPLAAWQEEHGRPFRFFTEASIDLAQDDELLDLMVAAGFSMVFVGIETPDRDTLAYTGKRQNLKSTILGSVEKIQRRGLEVTAGFILGFDTDPPDIFSRQIDFVQKAAIPVAMVGLLNALPGTQLWRRLEEEGRLRSATTGNNTHTLSTNFRPRMPEKELLQGYKSVLSALYAPGRYFDRCAALLRRLPPAAGGRRRGVSWREAKALGLSLLKQGLSSYGLRYLRFLLGSLVLHPGRFADAVAMAIKGHHFFRITGEILRAEEFSTRLQEARRALQLRVAAVVNSGEGRLAAETRRSILELQRGFRRRYASLTAGMQAYLAQTLSEFTRLCRRLLAELQAVG